MRFAPLILIFSLLPFAAHASTLLVSGSGSFSSQAPVTAFSAPSGIYDYSFSMDSNPVVSNVQPGVEFDVTFSDFSYSLNGNPLLATPTITFFSFNDFGLLNVRLDDATYLMPSGLQAYSGSESAPTILTGLYTLTPDSIFDYTGTGNVTVLTGAISITTATPEPRTWILLLAPLSLIAVWRRSQAPLF